MCENERWRVAGHYGVLSTYNTARFRQSAEQRPHPWMEICFIHVDERAHSKVAHFCTSPPVVGYLM